MANTVTRLEVEIAGNDAELRRTLNNSEQNTNEWGNNIARVGRAAIASFAGVAAGAFAAGVMINSLVAKDAELAKVLRNQATVADLTTQSFQELAYATSSIDIDGDKLGDILQDMQDKLGEFRRDGGGEFAAFFENVGAKVGLTADALAKLSGPDALVAVKNAMDQANVSADQQLTYLEEIASDASRLTPLLANNGEQWRKMAKNYRELDVALSNSELKELQTYSKNVRELGLVWDELSRSVVRPFVSLLAEGATKMQQLFNTSITEQISSNIREQTHAVKRISRLKDELDSLGDDPSDRNAAEEEKFQRFKRSYDAQTVFLKGLKSARDALNNPEGVSNLKTNLGTRSDVVGKLGPAYGPQNDPNLGKPDGKSSKGKKGLSIGSQQSRSGNVLAQLEGQFATELERIELQNKQRETKIRGLVLSEQQIKAAGFESMQSLQAAYLKNSDQLYSEDVEKHLQREIAEEQRKYAAVERALQFDITDEEREYAAAQSRQTIINDAFKGRADSEDAFRNASTKNWAEYEKNLENIQRAKVKMQLASYGSLFENLAGLTESFEGKQSNAYKAMFAASKAFAVAESLVSIQQGIANAWKLGWPLGIPAAASVISQTAGVIGTIKSTQYHTGGIIGDKPNLRPNEFPMVGLRGEEVLTETDPRHRNNLGGGKGNGGSSTVIIHNNGEPATATAQTDEQGDIHVWMERIDEYIGEGIGEGWSKTGQAVESFLGGNRVGAR